MLTPLFFVVILNRSIFAGQPTYFFPGAIAYVLFGILAGLYNIFGADGLGVQVYLLAPIRLRDVIVAKNLMSLSVITPTSKDLSRKPSMGLGRAVHVAGEEDSHR